MGSDLPTPTQPVRGQSSGDPGAFLCPVMTFPVTSGHSLHYVYMGKPESTKPAFLGVRSCRAVRSPLAPAGVIPGPSQAGMKKGVTTLLLGSVFWMSLPFHCELPFAF